MASFEVADGVNAVMDQGRVIYLPIKHLSPACALQVGRVIREERPACVLVEGPDDATPLIPFAVHDETEAPFTIFSYLVDKKNVHGLNGVLSSAPDLPARFRGWWPLTDFSPELEALRAGKSVGAELKLIDAPLSANIAFHHKRLESSEQVSGDGLLAESRYFEVLRQKQGRRSFDEFWNANFEVGGWHVPRERFRRALLTFAWCVRQGGRDEAALTADGTLMREAHMRFHINASLKQHPEGKVVVVVGAYHAVALPWTKPKKAKALKSREQETMLTSHSFRALFNIMSRSSGPKCWPGFQQQIWEKMAQGQDKPYEAAGLELLLEVMRRGREAGEGLSTADSVGAFQVASNLAIMRGNREPTLEDVRDAIQLGYVKGDVRLRGEGVNALVERALVGKQVGVVTDEVGQPPLFRDFYQRCKSNRIDVTGEIKTVRCDIHKRQAHQVKSAFLHQCDFLDVPIFSGLNDATQYDYSKSYYRGPDLSTGEGLHLITETWGVRWFEGVDDHLITLSDRGASMSQAAQSLLREQLADATWSAAETTRLLLKSAQMMMPEMFDELLSAVEAAIATDTVFEHLASALQDFTLLHSYRDALVTQGHQRLLQTVMSLYNRATLTLPALAGSAADETPGALDALQTLVRIAITFDAVELDRQLLIERLGLLVEEENCNPGVRGAAYGVLFSLGATREKVVARELTNYLLGAPAQVLQAGAFLEGLFISSKNIVMGSPRLLRAINDVLGSLEWDMFKMLLPDLRRAFTQFIPSELDELSARVSEEIGLSEPVVFKGKPSDGLIRIAATADDRVASLLQAWGV